MAPSLMGGASSPRWMMRANVVVLCVALLLTGCTGVETSSRRGGSRVLRQRAASVSDGFGETRSGTDAEDEDPEEVEGGQRLHRRPPERMPRGTVIIPPGPGKLSRQAVEMGLLDVDAFEKLLVRAGLEELDELPIRHNPFTPEDAVEVLGRLMQKPVTLGTFPTRMAAGFLLREVLERGDVSREELVRRVRRFAREQVAVLRPDGYLAWALDGSTQQKVAPVEWKGGGVSRGALRIGALLQRARRCLPHGGCAAAKRGGAATGRGVRRR
ncbi:hypothetical protein [Corallococcus sicarius]|uniref:Uncharacterized protein n=1 Tax=Corallococcus sicarius TaxID=2316726 RepID=A0A3A8NII6_9BACT|nr:hypothetical protein [Corallococcus sicarius]RKH44177.1 hypothetical protein D7X12_11195 [Corallococcus sicarius]